MGKNLNPTSAQRIARSTYNTYLLVKNFDYQCQVAPQVLSHSKRTESLCKLENAKVVRGIPELDASPNVDDGVGSKTRLKGTVEIKVTLANMLAYAILVKVWAFCLNNRFEKN
ncbi:unnamed protein product [Porites evermanni]|uniref:Uncharacterized protein n=1 Tax=Porites evermanni TaxID=104178 RepID=A0ABN8M5E8_9CNID|nr:unnamed protein product [Porites evermanni]